jgi:hypothetical protein
MSHHSTSLCNQSPATSIERLEQLHAEAELVLRQARAGGKHSLSLAAVKELRGIIELLAKLKGELSTQPQFQLNVLQSADFQRALMVILEALAAYPEARLAVARRLQAIEPPQ